MKDESPAQPEHTDEPCNAEAGQDRGHACGCFCSVAAGGVVDVGDAGCGSVVVSMPSPVGISRGTARSSVLSSRVSSVYSGVLLPDLVMCRTLRSAVPSRVSWTMALVASL